MIRGLWVALMTAAATAWYGSQAIGASLLGMTGPLYSRLTQRWARAILRASSAPVLTHGMEAVDWSQPQVLVANHISGYDIYAIAAVMPGPFAFVAKKELERIPLFGSAWKAAGHISIDRSDRQKAVQSLQRAAEKMRRDRTTVIIYPEGTRSRSGTLQPFKKGAFVLAAQARVPIIPVVVRDSDLIQKPGSFRISPHPIHLHFCAPVDPEAYGEQGTDAIIAAVRSEMLQVLREHGGARYAVAERRAGEAEA